jgi:glucose-6-phosphate 1-dehydrogenase
MDQECTALAIFGITGDLARKKIFAALYELAQNKQLPTQVIGVGRSDWDDAKLRKVATHAVRNTVSKEGTPLAVDESVLSELTSKLSFVRGEYDDEHLYQTLAERLSDHDLVLCYLAVPPTVFDNVIVGLAATKLRTRMRLLIEKPFGSDLASAHRLTELIRANFDAHQLFAVDHYLQKESLQNIIVLRFANCIFEPLWNSQLIKSVSITMAESFGIGERAGFFDRAGTLRDVVQNHALQIVAALAMEAPVSSDPAEINQKRSKVLGEIKSFTEADVVFGQYEGYLETDGVSPDSITDTFIRAHFCINHPRWHGVTWTITAGKALRETSTKIAITLADSDAVNFISTDCLPEPNQIVIGMAPKESLTLTLQTRSATISAGTTNAELTTTHDYRPEETLSPYARLFIDAARGDQTHFASDESVEHSWRIVDPLLHRTSKPLPYKPGSWGPETS